MARHGECKRAAIMTLLGAPKPPFQWQALAAFPAPLPKVQSERILISRTVPCVAGALWSSFEAIYTHHLTLEVANRCERAACSTRGALVSTWESNARSGRVAPRELALPGMRRIAHRSENVRRRGSIGRVWRLAQKAAQSSAPAVLRRSSVAATPWRLTHRRSQGRGRIALKSSYKYYQNPKTKTRISKPKG